MICLIFKTQFGFQHLTILKTPWFHNACIIFSNVRKHSFLNKCRQLVLYALWFTRISLCTECICTFIRHSHGQPVHHKKVWVGAIMSEGCVLSRNKTTEKPTFFSLWAFNVYLVYTSKLFTSNWLTSRLPFSQLLFILSWFEIPFL